MNMKLTSAGLIIAAIIVLVFVFSVPRARDTEYEESAFPTTADTIPTVTLRDSYAKGEHTISGFLLLPNPCTALTATAELVGLSVATSSAGQGGTASTTGSIVVRITAPADTSVCLQIPTQTKFSASITAPRDLPISVLVNGEAASTTLQ